MSFFKLAASFGVLSILSVKARPASSPYALKEQHHAPRGWTKIGPADKLQLIKLQMGLKQRDAHLVIGHLLEVSDPSHERYGQHLTAEEVRQLTAPADETVELVEAWLQEHGVSSMDYSPAKDWISVVVPISKAEEMLQTNYSTFRHTEGDELTRAEEWSLPQHLHEHIDVVQPTNAFLRMKSNRATWVGDDGAPPDGIKSLGSNSGSGPGTTCAAVANISAACNVSAVTPACLRTLYGTLDYKVQAAENNSIAICNYLNETSHRADTRMMLQRYRPEAAPAADTFAFQIIDDGQNDQGNYTDDQLQTSHNIEGNMDAQLVLSIAWPTPMLAINTGGHPPFVPDQGVSSNTNEPYLTFLNTVLNQTKLPRVISSSYGEAEQTVPESYAHRVCDGFAQLGARGVSVIFSSGDSGVGSDSECFTNDGKDTPRFMPNFPAGCPWVTTVGGTASFQPETAVTRYASGGGFSDYFPAPDYQKATVDAYIKSLNDQYPGLYNRSGRGYPDVAAQGDRDVVGWAGRFRLVGGTSAAAPTFAAVVALLNDALVAEGKAPLGFLNPWVYSSAHQALTDVTIGSSFGCGTLGFPAQAGWDPVTGFGTPVFGKLLDLVQAKAKMTRQ